MTDTKRKSKKTTKKSKTTYTAAMNRRGYAAALLGLTDKEIGAVLGVSEPTVNNWKKAYPAFAESLRKGKDVADQKVAESLYKRATGFRHKAVKIMQYEGVPVKEEYDEYVVPDVTACIFWLKNRQPRQWRDKQEIAQHHIMESLPDIVIRPYGKPEKREPGD
jgi:hypothetical protein